MTSSTSTSLTDALVRTYLEQRGYHHAAAALPPSAQVSVSGSALARSGGASMEASVGNRVLLASASADQYVDAYARLRDWAHGSLDMYKARRAGEPSRPRFTPRAPP